MSAAPAERIRTYGARCLRQVAAPAEAGTPATAELLDRLWSILEADGGVGLAAPQVGVSRRVVVVKDPERPPREQRLDLVNPELKTTFGEPVPFLEGCLSFPGLFFQVMRPSGVVVEYVDRDARPGRISDESLLARILQHEMDHLEGVLFIDRISFWRRLTLWPRLIWFRLKLGGGS